MADAVGVTLNLDLCEFGVVEDEQRNLIQQTVALNKQRCRAGLKIDLVLDDDAIIGNARTRLRE